MHRAAPRMRHHGKPSPTEKEPRQNHIRLLTGCTRDQYRSLGAYQGSPGGSRRTAATGDFIFQPVQAIVTVRVPMNHAIQLPNGEVTHMRDEMPNIDIRHIEIKRPRDHADNVKKLTTTPLALLPQLTEERDDAGQPQARTRAQAKADTLTNREMKRIHINCHRLLSMAAVDYRSFYILAEVEDPVSLANLNREEDMRRREAGSAVSQFAAKTTVEESIDAAKKILRRAATTIAPTGRFAMVFWAFNESPVLAECYSKPE
ncbi:uncharacterized protein B0T15DRAFT_554036 [Chaetomium strumarium]|uniref:Uncharacterized protein n=1 Tax=Chaetomium strumarium TaxID=1170767 RepID=A0AAJ0M361_9PEZI|nr:hypothetical protein B0T15DRAFT_554036 [Chaetomium strumarium]